MVDMEMNSYIPFEVNSSQLLTTEQMSRDNTTHEDFTETTGPPDIPYWDITTRVIFSVLLGVVMVFAVTGNILIILVIAKNHGMRTRTNILLCNLAVADLACGLFDIPISMVTMAAGGWKFNNAVCQFNGFATPFFLVASIHTLMYTSIHKYLSITRPFSYGLRKKWIYVMLGVTWGWAALSGYVTVHGLNHVTYKPFSAQCGPGYPTDTKTYTHFGIFTAANYYIPMVVMIFCYGNVFREMRAHSFRMQKNTTMDKDTVLNQQRRVTTTVFLVLLVFVISWMPYNILVFCTAFLKDTMAPAKMNPISYLFGYANSAVNPVVYALRSESFLQGYKQVVCCTQPLLPRRDYHMYDMMAKNFTRFKTFLQENLQVRVVDSDLHNGSFVDSESSLTRLASKILFPKTRTVSTSSLPHYLINRTAKSPLYHNEHGEEGTTDTWSLQSVFVMGNQSLHDKSQNEATNHNTQLHNCLPEISVTFHEDNISNFTNSHHSKETAVSAEGADAVFIEEQVIVHPDPVLCETKVTITPAYDSAVCSDIHVLKSHPVQHINAEQNGKMIMPIHKSASASFLDDKVFDDPKHSKPSKQWRKHILGSFVRLKRNTEPYQLGIIEDRKHHFRRTKSEKIRKTKRCPSIERLDFPIESRFNFHRSFTGLPDSCKENHQQRRLKMMRTSQKKVTTKQERISDSETDNYAINPDPSSKENKKRRISHLKQRIEKSFAVASSNQKTKNEKLEKRNLHHSASDPCLTFQMIQDKIEIEAELKKGKKHLSTYRTNGQRNYTGTNKGERSDFVGGLDSGNVFKFKPSRLPDHTYDRKRHRTSSGKTDLNPNRNLASPVSQRLVAEVCEQNPIKVHGNLVEENKLDFLPSLITMKVDIIHGSKRISNCHKRWPFEGFYTKGTGAEKETVV